MVDSKNLNGDEFKEEAEPGSDEEMFPLTGTSQQFELKDLDSQTIELFNSQTYADDACKVLNNNDFATHSEGFELPVSVKSLERLEPGQTIDMEVYTAPANEKPTSTSLEHLKQFPAIDAMLLPWINFRVNLPSEASDKTSWKYSEVLNKLFVKMGNTCSFNVSLAAASKMSTIVRVMLVCSAPEEQHNPVSRCDNHRCNDHTDISDDIKTHVVRCKNEQFSYVGNKEGKLFEERLAILIPMGQTNKTGITLEFVCQNSCRNINRRSTALVFTLENEAGQILGRQAFPIKICTNIKRDMLNEEKAELEENIRKRKAARPLEMRRGKKMMRYHSAGRLQQPVLHHIKEESGGARHCELDPVTVQVTLPNRRMAKRMLENVIGHISSAILRTSSERDRTQLMQYVHDIRRTKSSIGFVNSQSSVDSDI
ncbi:cellular tumor antigen p53-like isoform X2 [Malaya genurostris]|uniref:cellular tumor antigen p53-like isoform X2 n=1 Tax=Malaya genurostris TaxID=325434 RepID=UPI0026F39097|nr:cellular tumor antigen p53-like isoform X2 [Malaya genurostris]